MLSDAGSPFFSICEIGAMEQSKTTSDRPSLVAAPDDVAVAHAPAGSLSLEGMHGSVNVPSPLANFWKQWRAYTGPALLISVGYMDPGNWGTDLSSGAEYK